MGSTITCAPSRSRKSNMWKLPSPSVICAQNSPVIFTTGFTLVRSTSMEFIRSRGSLAAHSSNPCPTCVRATCRTR